MSKPGNYRGKHFTTWVEAVKDFKSRGRDEEAIELLQHLVDATEAESRSDGLGVAPWYYEQLAILFRKAGDSDAELSILERYESQRHAPGVKPAKLAARLKDARDGATVADR